MGRLTLVMTTMMFLQEAFSRPTWEGSETHLWVATHSLRSSALVKQVHVESLTQDIAATITLCILKRGNKKSRNGTINDDDNDNNNSNYQINQASSEGIKT